MPLPRTVSLALGMILLAGCSSDDDVPLAADPRPSTPVGVEASPSAESTASEEAPPSEFSAEELAEGGDPPTAERIAELRANAPEDRAGNSQILDVAGATITECSQNGIAAEVANDTDAERHFFILVAIADSAGTSAGERAIYIANVAPGQTGRGTTDGAPLDDLRCTVDELRSADTDVAVRDVDWVSLPES